VLAPPAAAGDGITSLPTDERAIALTFDLHTLDPAPRAEGLETLAILRSSGVSCTFFLTGRTLLARPALAGRLAADGHEVANHGFSHAWVNPGDEREDRLLGELGRTQDLLAAGGVGATTRLWRAPYGNVTPQHMAWARAGLGLTHVGWTLDLLDWESDRKSSRFLDARALLARFVRLLDGDRARGAVVLCHLETSREGEFLHQVLPAMIGEARARGYRFVRVSELAPR
jgi:peptidoglycan/xylan/chitin deacetylase (PgdA/CDA1 family)